VLRTQARLKAERSRSAETKGTAQLNASKLSLRKPSEKQGCTCHLTN